MQLGFRDTTSAWQCFNVEAIDLLDEDRLEVLKWLLEETFEPGSLKSESAWNQEGKGFASVIEIGPRLNFSTPWSTNAVSICHSCGLRQIGRIEKSTRYHIHTRAPLTPDDLHRFAESVLVAETHTFVE